MKNITEEQLVREMKHVRPECILAAIEWNRTREINCLYLAVLGILLRHAPEANADGVLAMAGEDVAAIPDSTRIVEELGLDSLAVMEVLFTIEGALGIRLDAAEVAKCATLSDIARLIDQTAQDIRDDIDQQKYDARTAEAEADDCARCQPPEETEEANEALNNMELGPDQSADKKDA